MEFPTFEPFPSLCPGLPARRRRSTRFEQGLGMAGLEQLGLELFEQRLAEELVVLGLLEQVEELVLIFPCSCFSEWLIE